MTSIASTRAGIRLQAGGQHCCDFRHRTVCPQGTECAARTRSQPHNHSPCRKRMSVLCFLGDTSTEVTNKHTHVRSASARFPNRSLLTFRTGDMSGISTMLGEAVRNRREHVSTPHVPKAEKWPRGEGRWFSCCSGEHVQRRYPSLVSRKEEEGCARYLWSALITSPTSHLSVLHPTSLPRCFLAAGAALHSPRSLRFPHSLAFPWAPGGQQ